MSDNNPELDATETDEVEGHAISSSRGATSGRFRPDEDEMFGDDVQGHGTLRGGLVEDGADEVEGHGVVRGSLVEDDDTEGHAARGNG
jgi:hypothetical protein